MIVAWKTFWCAFRHGDHATMARIGMMIWRVNHPVVLQ